MLLYWRLWRLESISGSHSRARDEVFPEWEVKDSFVAAESSEQPRQGSREGGSPDQIIWGPEVPRGTFFGAESSKKLSLS